MTLVSANNVTLIVPNVPDLILVLAVREDLFLTTEFVENHVMKDPSLTSKLEFVPPDVTSKTVLNAYPALNVMFVTKTSD